MAIQSLETQGLIHLVEIGETIRSVQVQGHIYARRGNSTIQDAGNGEDIIHDSGTSVIIQNKGTDTVFLQSAPNAIVVAD